MFESLSEKLTKTFKKLTNRGVVTESNISASLKEVKVALLEADVNYKVVKSFLKSVKKRALGKEVLNTLTPGQQFIKVVQDELVKIMSSENQALGKLNNKVTVLMMVGLQGSGKTTTSAKIASFLKKRGNKVYLVPADTYRPAAIEQLKQLSLKIDIPCYDSNASMHPEDIALNAYLEAEKRASDYMIIDTAGRLHVDENLMNELSNIKKKVDVHEVLLVTDAMTGQDAVNVAKSFNDKLSVNGFILTKMDGDARGGAALSIRAITGAPIKFLGLGEKIDDLEAFHPDRIVSKMLGLGDLLGLIEKAQEHFDAKKSKDLENKIKKNQFTLGDFQSQLKHLQKMGSMTDLLGMIPGMNQKKIAGSVDEKSFLRIDAIISSMTSNEKENHQIINGSRKLRIAKGSGTEVSEINRLLKQFIQMKKTMKKFSSMGNNKNSARAMQSLVGSQSNFF